VGEVGVICETDLHECFYNAENMIRSSRDIVEGWTKLEYTERGIIETVKKFGNIMKFELFPGIMELIVQKKSTAFYRLLYIL